MFTATAIAPATAFTVKSVQGMLREALPSLNLVQPGEEETGRLVCLLNRLAGQLQLDETEGQGAASDVRRGLDYFDLLFERRRAAAAAQEAPPGVLKAEEQLQQQFLVFRDAMTSHPYELEIDRGRALRWHDYAELVASAFVATVAWYNPKVVIGSTGRGPLARFLEAVIPKISEETPTAETIGKFLQRRAKRLAQITPVADSEESGYAYLRREAKRLAQAGYRERHPKGDNP